jgi:hypothetical protein
MRSADSEKPFSAFGHVARCPSSKRHYVRTAKPFNLQLDRFLVRWGIRNVLRELYVGIIPIIHTRVCTPTIVVYVRNKQIEDPDKFLLPASFTILITNHAMSFHWDFFRRQAAAEMRFAAAVENTYLFPEWQNPLLMNYTRNGDYKTLERALYSAWLLPPLPYGFPLSPRIASARLLGRSIHAVSALEPPSIPEGCATNQSLCILVLRSHPNLHFVVLVRFVPPLPPPLLRKKRLWKKERLRRDLYYPVTPDLLPSLLSDDRML